MNITTLKTIDCVPNEQIERLQKFRSEHPYKRIPCNDVEWEYISCGRGTEVILLLTGGLRIAETSFAYIQMLEDAYRIIAPSYPPLNTMRELADGIATILNSEKVSSAFILGQSYGGAVAQVLIHCYPLLVKKVVLSGTAPMMAIGWKKHLSGVMLAIATVLPERTVLRFFEKMLSPMLSVQESTRAFWKMYLKELCRKRLTKADVLSHLRTTLDMQMNYAYKGSVKSNWGGDVLVVWGENDNLRTEGTRKGMLEIYPQAQIRIIAKAGHTAAMAEPEKYAAIVSEFLS